MKSVPHKVDLKFIYKQMDVLDESVRHVLLFFVFFKFRPF